MLILGNLVMIPIVKSPITIQEERFLKYSLCKQIGMPAALQAGLIPLGAPQPVLPTQTQTLHQTNQLRNQAFSPSLRSWTGPLALAHSSRVALPANKLIWFQHDSCPETAPSFPCSSLFSLSPVFLTASDIPPIT